MRSVSFTPSETLTLSASLDTSLGPSTDTPGDTDVAYTLSGDARYIVNPWLTLRGSASWDRTVTLGNGDIDSGYSAGAGLDVAESTAHRAGRRITRSATATRRCRRRPTRTPSRSA